MPERDLPPKGLHGAIACVNIRGHMNVLSLVTAAIPTAWLSAVDEPEIERLLAVKHITPDRTVVVYGDGPGEGDSLVARLRASGFREVRTYDAGFRAWAADDASRSTGSRASTGSCTQAGCASSWTAVTR